MMLVVTPFAICLVGLLMYALCAAPKLCELGRIMFFCGLWVTLWSLGHAGGVVKL
jgi:hypothetical protein